MSEIRIVVCGDVGVGKSSLIVNLLKGSFSRNVQKVIPNISVPPDSLALDPVQITIVDTSSSPSDRTELLAELRKASTICLVYCDSFTCDRVTIHWLPWLRSSGINVPIILCYNKCDFLAEDDVEHNARALKYEHEMELMMQEFREFEASVLCSAKYNINVNELFYLCRRSVTHPLAPIWDSKEQCLKPNAIAALERIFILSNQTKNNYLSDDEICKLQLKCFRRELPAQELEDIKSTLAKIDPDYVTDLGISKQGFLTLHKLYSDKGRQETIWQILRCFYYTNSMSLEDKILRPKLDLNDTQIVELRPLGFSFLVDLFYLYDKDNDAALSQSELDALLSPTPGIPQAWKDWNFPYCTVLNDQGCITYNGWLALWSMTTILDSRTTLEYFAYLGFYFDKDCSYKDAVKVTKRKPRMIDINRRKNKDSERNCFTCFICGPKESGKTSLLRTFLNNNYLNIGSDISLAVNSVETDNKIMYLVMQEFNIEDANEMLNNLTKCDVLCLCYDSSDPDSFSGIQKLLLENSKLKTLPIILAATKADLDRAQQRSEIQPAQFADELGIMQPIFVSSAWRATSELFVRLARACQDQKYSLSTIRNENEKANYKLFIAVTAFSALIVSISTSLLWKLIRQRQ